MHHQWWVCGILSLMFVCGCGSADDTGKREPGSSSAVQLSTSLSAPRVYQHSLRLVSDLEQEQLRARVPDRPGSTFPIIFQVLRREQPGSSNPDDTAFYRLQGDQEPFIAYAAESDYTPAGGASTGPNLHKAVMAVETVGQLAGSYVWRFTTPDDSPKLFWNEFSRGPLMTDSEVVVHFQRVEFPTRDNPNILTINGQEITRTSGHFRQLGLESSQSGQYSVAFSFNGEEKYRHTYVQRGLRFPSPLPELDVVPGQNVTLNTPFEWDAGPGAVEGHDPKWEVRISDPSPSPAFATVTKSGTGSTIAFQWDPSESVLARGQASGAARRVRLVPKERWEDKQKQGVAARIDSSTTTLTYSVNASAITYTSADFPGVGGEAFPPRRHYLARGATIGSTRSVTIGNIAWNPTSFNPNPEAGEISTLRAQVNINGYQNPELDWTATIRSQSTSALVRMFVGAAGNLNSGTAFIEKDWDGLDSDDVAVPPGDYDVELSVTVTEAAGGEPRTASATADVNVGGGVAKLEVYNSAGNVVASSDEAKAAEVRGDVFPYGIPNQSPNWTVNATNLKFTGSPPGSIKVFLRGAITQASPRPATLTRVGTSGGNYTGPFVVSSSLIAADGQLAVNGTTVQTTYSGADAVLSSVSSVILSTFRALMDTKQFLPPYPAARARLGEYRKIPVDGLSDEQATVETVEAARTLGFEAVNVTLDPDPDPAVTSKLVGSFKAISKVRHPANVMYINAHGGHADGSLLLKGGDAPIKMLAADIAGTNPSSLKTLILASCSALDLNDYNNYFALGGLVDFPGAEEPLRKSFDDPLAIRAHPGKQWWDATRAGRTVLLGYNCPVADGVVAQVMARYRAELKTLADAGTGPDVIQQLAWMKANLAIASLGPLAAPLPAPNPSPDPPPQTEEEANAILQRYQYSALFACAWDDNYYYYIPHTTEAYVTSLAQSRVELPDSLARYNSTLRNNRQAVYRVPKSKWSTPPIWSAMPPLDVAEPVDLP